MPKTKHDKFTVEVLGQIEQTKEKRKPGRPLGSLGKANKKPSRYVRPRKVTTLTPAKAKFAQVYATTDNATEAVRQAYPIEAAKLTKGSLHNKAFRLLSNDAVKNEILYQQNRMQQLASKAVDKIEDTMDGENEDLVFKASKFVYEQTHGQATKKVEKTVRTVEVKLDLTGVRIGAHYIQPNQAQPTE
jgi:hypothetical protein